MIIRKSYSLSSLLVGCLLGCALESVYGMLVRNMNGTEKDDASTLVKFDEMKSRGNLLIYESLYGHVMISSFDQIKAMIDTTTAPDKTTIRLRPLTTAFVTSTYRDMFKFREHGNELVLYWKGKPLQNPEEFLEYDKEEDDDLWSIALAACVDYTRNVMDVFEKYMHKEDEINLSDITVMNLEACEDMMQIWKKSNLLDIDHITWLMLTGERSGDMVGSKTISENISAKIFMPKNRVLRAIRWLEMAMHTEVQLAVLHTKKRSLPCSEIVRRKPGGVLYSWLNPCNSCMKMINRAPSEFHFLDIFLFFKQDGSKRR